MASRPSSELAPAVAMEAEAGGPAAAVATLPLPIGVDHKQAVGRPGDVRGRKLRRLLLAGDVIALCSAFLGTQLVFGAVELRGPPPPASEHPALGPARLRPSPLPPGQLPRGLRCRGRDRPGAPDGHALELGHVAGPLRRAARARTCVEGGALLGARTDPPDGPAVGNPRLRKASGLVPAERVDHRTPGSGDRGTGEDPAPPRMGHQRGGLRRGAGYEPSPPGARQPPAGSCAGAGRRPRHRGAGSPPRDRPRDAHPRVQRVAPSRRGRLRAVGARDSRRPRAQLVGRRRDPLRGERDGGHAALDHAPTPPHAHVAAPQASARPRSRRGRARCPGAGARGLRDRDQARLTGARAVSPAPRRP